VAGPAGKTSKNPVRRSPAVQIAEVRDAAVARVVQPCGRRRGALAVVDGDGVHALQVDHPVHRDQRRAEALCGAQRVVGPAGRDHDQAVGAARGERLDQVPLAARVLVAAAGQDHDPALGGGVGDRALEG
jgi:hypothetical protein